MFLPKLLLFTYTCASSFFIIKISKSCIGKTKEGWEETKIVKDREESIQCTARSGFESKKEKWEKQRNKGKVKKFF